MFALAEEKSVYIDVIAADPLPFLFLAAKKAAETGRLLLWCV